MATVNHIEFSQFNIAIGDGATPEVFTPRCTINLSRSFTLTPNFNEIELPDCADDNLPSFIFRAMTSIQAEVGGNGVMEASDLAFFNDWILQNQVKNVRVMVGASGAGQQWDFPAKMGPFSPTSEKNGVVTADISILSHGTITSGPIP